MKLILAGMFFSRNATEPECGFLSNYKEAEKLGTEAYQELMAKGILEEILVYLEVNTQTPSNPMSDTTVEPNATITQVY